MWRLKRKWPLAYSHRPWHKIKVRAFLKKPNPSLSYFFHAECRHNMHKRMTKGCAWEHRLVHVRDITRYLRIRTLVCMHITSEVPLQVPWHWEPHLESHLYKGSLTDLILDAVGDQSWWLTSG